jgi:H+/Na+-translocating ferredoxin:NAD+ oxidoreductase subunit B
MEPQDKPYVDLGGTLARGAIGAPVTDTQTQILRMLFSPDEARCAAALDFAPDPEEIIARRAGMDPDVVADLLTRIASRGLIRGVRRPDGIRVFRLPLFFPGLFEMVSINPSPSVDTEKIGALFDSYFRQAWGREMHGHAVSVARALPHISPPREQVLPYEDAVKLVEAASVALHIDCSCREAVRACDCPLDVCIVIGEGALGGHLEGAPVRDQRYVVGPPRARRLSIDESVHVLDRAEKAGLVHTTLNVQQDSWFICNCCSHACFLLRGATELDIPHAVAPSSFWSVIDEDECNGCGACEAACHLSAIKLVDGKLAEVDYERCLGCGVCVSSCPTEAIRLEKRGDEIYTPSLDYNDFVAARGMTHRVHSH